MALRLELHSDKSVGDVDGDLTTEALFILVADSIPITIRT
jgi:hypothetical protein